MKTGNWKEWRDGCGWLMGASLILTGLGSLTTAQASQVADPKETGPYEVGIVRDMITNGGRNVPVYIFYPVDKSSLPLPASSKFNYEIWTTLQSDGEPNWVSVPSAIWEQNGVDVGYNSAPVSSKGPFPMVVFSNGGGCETTLHIKHHTRLASHGIVVAAVLWHTTDFPFGASCQSNTGRPGSDRLHYYRPRNIQIMLDRVLARNSTAGDLLNGKIDASKIVATGMSLGGSDVLALVAGRSNTTGTIVPDPRIGGVILLDGSTWMFRAEDLKKITVPLLTIGKAAGTAAAPFPNPLNGVPGIHTARVHNLASSGVKYRVDVQKTTHGSHIVSNCAYLYVAIDAGLLAGPRSRFDGSCNNPSKILLEADYQKTMFTYVIAFLRTHIEEKLGYGDVLTPGWTINADANADFFSNSNGGSTDYRPQVAANGCTNIDGDFQYRLRQPGMTTNNASTDRAETSFTDAVDMADEDDLKGKLLAQ